MALIYFRSVLDSNTSNASCSSRGSAPKHGPNVSQFNKAFKQLDQDGSGTIDYSEFVAWWQKQKARARERLQRSAASTNGASPQPQPQPIPAPEPR